jgi:hypothetical protein
MPLRRPAKLGLIGLALISAGGGEESLLDDDPDDSRSGARVHRMYAARMRAEPACAGYVNQTSWAYPFEFDLSSPSRRGGGGGANATAPGSSERALLQLGNRSRVWTSRAGYGLGNSLLGFAHAFSRSLLEGPCPCDADGEDCG